MPASTATATDVAALAARVPPGARVGVDGRDAAGKTSFARALAAALGATVVSIDDFHRPAEERVYYYRDAFDLAAFAAAVRAVRGTVVGEGVFLFRPELDDLWDVRIRVEVDPDEQWRRAAARGDALDRYATRYRPAHAAYEAAVRPGERADVVLRWP